MSSSSSSSFRQKRDHIAIDISDDEVLDYRGGSIPRFNDAVDVSDSTTLLKQEKSLVSDVDTSAVDDMLLHEFSNPYPDVPYDDPQAQHSENSEEAEAENDYQHFTSTLRQKQHQLEECCQQNSEFATRWSSDITRVATQTERFLRILESFTDTLTQLSSKFSDWRQLNERAIHHVEDQETSLETLQEDRQQLEDILKLPALDSKSTSTTTTPSLPYPLSATFTSSSSSSSSPLLTSNDSSSSSSSSVSSLDSSSSNPNLLNITLVAQSLSSLEESRFRFVNILKSLSESVQSDVLVYEHTLSRLDSQSMFLREELDRVLQHSARFAQFERNADFKGDMLDHLVPLISETAPTLTKTLQSRIVQQQVAMCQVKLFLKFEKLLQDFCKWLTVEVTAFADGSKEIYAERQNEQTGLRALTEQTILRVCEHSLTALLYREKIYKDEITQANSQLETAKLARDNAAKEKYTQSLSRIHDQQAKLHAQKETITSILDRYGRSELQQLSTSPKTPEKQETFMGFLGRLFSPQKKKDN